MSGLTASVGENGKNLPHDVMAVEKRLRIHGLLNGPANGTCGSETIAAIRRFQSGFLIHVDGRVDPRGKTLQRLNAPPVGQWAGDSSKWSQDKKLQSLNPLLRPKVEAVLDALSKRGFQPKVFYGWRSVAVQLKLYQLGNSKVKFSFHNAQKPDGTPDSYAADIVDSRYGWAEDARTSGFWDALGEEAKAQGLYWGGDWSSFRDWAHVQLVANGQLHAVKRLSGL